MLLKVILVIICCFLFVVLVAIMMGTNAKRAEIKELARKKEFLDNLKDL